MIQTYLHIMLSTLTSHFSQR